MAKTVKTAMRFGDNLLDVLRGFIRMFEKGVDEVVAFFKKIIDDFFDWLEDMFKKGKADEVLDIKRLTRKATQADIDELAIIRKLFNAGRNKNVAFTKGEIGGIKIDLKSRSGQSKGTPKNFDNFKTIDPLNYHYKGTIPEYINHTEQKQIEYLYHKFKHNKQIEGQIDIVSDLKICDNCNDVIKQFEKDFPNITIIRVWVKEKL
ncbi:MAG: deaminase domain-containing protein [Flavobacteriaceae bacterium]|jgi:hypothetical protein|nr:deaminase domain-containing protein [Flavobacteriaceae bacterium]